MLIRRRLSRDTLPLNLLLDVAYVQSTLTASSGDPSRNRMLHRRCLEQETYVGHTSSRMILNKMLLSTAQRLCRHVSRVYAPTHMSNGQLLEISVSNLNRRKVQQR